MQTLKIHFLISVQERVHEVYLRRTLNDNIDHTKKKEASLIVCGGAYYLEFI
jgi:hypothetical protein